MHSWKKDGCTRILVAENQSASHPDSMTKAGVSVKETSAFLEKRGGLDKLSSLTEVRFLDTNMAATPSWDGM